MKKKTILEFGGGNFKCWFIGIFVKQIYSHVCR